MVDFFQDYNQQNQQAPPANNVAPAISPPVSNGPNQTVPGAPASGPDIHRDYQTMLQAPTTPVAQTTGGLAAAAYGLADGVSKFTGPITDWAARKVLTNINGWSDQDVTNAIADRQKLYDTAQQEHPIAYGTGKITGTVAAITPLSLAASTAIPEAAAGAGIAARAGLGAADLGVQGAVVGGAMTPDDGNSRLGNAAKGALIGGALGGLGSAAKAGLTSFKPDAAESVADLTKAGITPSYADVSTNKANNIAVNQIMMKIPSWLGGMGDTRNLQNGQIQNMLQGMITGMAGDATKDGVVDSKAIASAVQNQYSSAKALSDSLYGDVSAAAKAADAGPVQLTNLNNVLQNPPNMLNGTVNSMIKKMGDSVSQPMDFQDVANLRSTLGNKLSQVGSQINNGSAAHDDYQYVKALQDSLGKDLDQWGQNQNSLDVIQKYNAARSNYSAFQSVFSDPSKIQKVVEDHANAFSTINGLLTNKNPALAQDTMYALGSDAPKARAFQLQNALFGDGSPNSGSLINGPQGPVLNLDKFLTTLNKPGDNAQKVIWGSDYTKLQGLNKMLQTMQPGQSALLDSIRSPGKSAAEALGGAATGVAGAMAAPGSTAAVGALGAITRVANSPSMLPMLMRWGGLTDAVNPTVLDNLKAETINSMQGKENSILNEYMAKGGSSKELHEYLSAHPTNVP